MKIEEVTEVVWSKRNELILKSKSPDDPINLAVYMDYEYWVECKREFVNAGYCGSSYEFYDADTVLGFPVYRVTPMTNRHGDVRHVPFRVVNLDA